MAADPNSGFHLNRNLAPGAAFNRHAIQFQSGAVNSSSEMIQMGNYFGVNSSMPMVLTGNPNIISNYPAVTQPNNASCSLFFDSVPPLSHENGSLAEWSVEEQYRLEEGLIKFSNEPSVMKYVKIAATLQDKTVRDVALRCRWMTRKRRKSEESNMAKRVKDRKDKFVESSSTSKTYLPSVSSLNMAPYSFMMHRVEQNDRTCYEVSGIAKHLLDQNAQVFEQITANLSTYKIQDNIDLFCRTRNNIIAVLNDMKEMPGIMSQMPPLPVCINEDLANSILPSTTQTMMFGSPPGMQIKQEPRC